nr:unnamed protein product [Digitaria exilis]
MTFLVEDDVEDLQSLQASTRPSAAEAGERGGRRSMVRDRRDGMGERRSTRGRCCQWVRGERGRTTARGEVAGVAMARGEVVGAAMARGEVKYERASVDRRRDLVPSR